MPNEFIVKNGLVVGGNVVTSGTITINGALAATQSWVTSQAYLTSASLSGYATQSYVTSALAALVDAAPAALDTLNELAAALGDDANFSTTITNSIAAKLPLAGGTLTGDLNLNYGYPRINFYDDNHNPDYSLINNDGGFSLYDITNNVHRIWVSSVGNTGIGTTSPDTPLVVQGGSAGTDGWNRTATLSATYPGLIFNSNGTKWGGMAYDYSAAMRFWVNASNNDIFAGNLAMSILNNGNVGIGITSPDSRLHIEGNTTGSGSGADAIVHIKQNGAWNGNEPWALYVEGYSYLNGFRVNAADGQRGLYTDAAQLGFAVGGNSPISFTQNTSDYRMYIAPGGNIGIGTTSPGSKLTVYSDTTADGIVIDVLSRPRITLRDRGNSDTIIGTGDYGLDDFFIDTYSGNALAIKGSTRNVGIGTSSPNEKLHVAGNINAYVNGGIDAGLFASTSAGSTTIALRSNGITHFNGGSVGIGTFSPTDSLSVQGNTNLGNSYGSTTSSTYTTRVSGYAMRYDASNRYGNYGVLILNADSGWTSSARRFMLTSGLNVNKFAIIRSVDSTTDPSFGDGGAISSGTADFVIDSTGLVGIGTTSPSEKLHVSGRIMASGSGYTLNPTAPIFGQYSSTRGYVQVPSNGQFEIWTGGTSEIATFYNNQNAAFFGKVGIGTTTPAEELHVIGRGIFNGGSGDSSTDAVLYITKSNNNDWGLYVNAAALDYGMYARVSSSANYALAIHNGTTWTTRITGDGRIYLTEKDTIASYDTWLRLNESGHYGSGVYTPGVMRADGGFQVSGNTVIHSGTIGSQSVSYATSAGSATLAGYVNNQTGQLASYDNRTISPSETNAAYLQFGFTSWANNNSAPYADYLHLRSYPDSSGGSDNLVMFLKSGIGMRIYQQTFGSASAYSSYADVWHSGNLTNLNQLTNGPGYITASALSPYLPLAGGTMSGILTFSSAYNAYIYTFSRVGLANQGRIIYNNGTGSNMFFGELASNVYGFTTNAYTDTPALSFNLSTNNVGIGTASPGTNKLHVFNGSSGGVAYNPGGLVVESSGRASIQLLAPNNQDSYLFFGDANSGTGGYIGHYGTTMSPADLMVYYSEGNHNFTNGNVGIGISSPAYKLDVNGETRLGKLITTWSNSPISPSAVMYSESGYNTVFAGNGQFSTSYLALMTTGNMSYMGGNVGIGTTSPTNSLEVQGAADTSIQAIFQSSSVGNAAYNGGIQLGNAGSNQKSSIVHTSAGDNTLTFTSHYSSGSANKFIFAPGGTETVRFQQNGNVGIGTTAPSTKLEVGNFLDAVTNKITVAARYEYEPEFNFRLGQSGTNLNWVGAVISSGDDGNYNGKILFKTAVANREAPTTKMAIKANGNVGIGTVSPSEKLDVLGNIKIYNETGLITDYGPLIGRYNTSQVYVGTGGSYSIVKIGRADGGALNVLSGGNVGIGTDSPNYKLDVAGYINIYTGNGLRWGSGDAEIINSGYNLLFKTYNGSALAEAMRINTAGKVSIGTTDTNSDKSDFTVYTGSGASLALVDDQVRMGSTDVNWGVALRSTGYLETYGQALYLQSVAGNHPVVVRPNNTSSVEFYQDYTLFNGLNLSISRVNSTHAANYFRGDSSHLVIGTGGTLYLNYGGNTTNITGNTTNSGWLGVTGIVSANARKLSLGILDLNTSGTPGQYKIKTNIPWNYGGSDFTVNIKGFRYGVSQMVSLSVGWHFYANQFYNRNAISNGAWAPTITLAKSPDGYVIIHIPGPDYWAKLYVESVYSSNSADSYTSGWSWTDADLSDCTLIQTVPYRDLATNISGNAATATSATTAGALSSMNISQFTNNSGYITGYTETDTLNSVTGRGNTTGNNIITSANVYASIFYDYSDNGYYLDPNGNSVLTTATFNVNASSILILTSAGTNASQIKAGAGDELYIGGNNSWQMRFSGANVLMDNGGYLQNNESLRAPIFYDSNDTNYYGDFAGTSRFNNLYIEGAVASLYNASGYASAAIEVRERNFGGAQDDTFATAPRIGFHWAGRVAAQIALASNGRIHILNDPGTANEGFQAGIIYSSGYGDSSQWNTAYGWGNHASYSYATTSYVTTQINNLIAGAPGALDTLDELAAALGDDASFATTVTNSIAGKVPLAGGTMTGDLVIGVGAATGSSQPFGDFSQLRFDNLHSDTSRGPNKIVMHNNDAWIGGFGLHSDTVSYYTGGHHRWYKSNSQVSFTQVMQLDASGNLTIAGSLTESSSIKLKENVETSEGNLEKVVNLRPVTYNKIGSQTKELGLIAEEVATVYPEFVQYDESGEPVGVNYSRLTAALIGAVKELTQRIETLENNG